jgi:ATP synthase alpha/beta chain, C terminal domain
VSKQVTILQAATTGKLDDVPTARVKEFETGLYRFIETEHPEIFKNLDEKPELTDDITRAITDAIDTFRRDAFGLDEAPAEKAEPAEKAAAAEKAAPAEKATPAEKAAPAEDADTSTEEGS